MNAKLMRQAACLITSKNIILSRLKKLQLLIGIIIVVMIILILLLCWKVYILL